MILRVCKTSILFAARLTCASWAKWNDCANFVSQALYAGGMKMKYGPSYTHSTSWSYGVVPSYTWGGAHNFYTHWKTRAGVANSSTALQTGDAVSADFTKDGDIDHTALITKNTGNASNQKFLTQHTTDRKEMDLSQDFGHKKIKFFCCTTTIHGVFHIPSRLSK